MPSWLLSIPYPAPDQPGYWNPVTSTLQWCEEDYYATYYSAEIINTLTNLIFVFLAWKGVQSCRRHGHDTVFLVAYCGYFLVAAGSMMFHTTLKYPWQLVDELNMIYTTCLMCWASMTYSRGVLAHWLWAFFFTGLSAGITAYYHYLQDPVFHQNCYAALTVFIVVRTCWQMETTLRPKWRHSTEADRLEKEKRGLTVLSRQEQERQNVRDTKILNGMWKLICWGVSVFLGGFALWGIDNQFCGTLRTWRRSLGMPWGFLLELHGWWHLMTGIGAYCYIAWGIHLRHVLDGHQDAYVMQWKSWVSLPVIVKVDHEHLTNNGYAALVGDIKTSINGHSSVTSGKPTMNGNGHLRTGKGRK